MKPVPFRHWVVARADDDYTAIRFEDESWTYREAVQAGAERAAFVLAERREGRPLHVGVLLENVPEFWFWLAAAALSGGVVVGINPTRRGAELARDIRHTDCQWIVTDAEHRELLEGLEIEAPILQVDGEDYRAKLASFAGAPIPDVEVGMSDCLLLIFTSGTSGTPKAVICTQRKLSFASQNVARTAGLGRESVTYVAMPMFHSNCLFMGWGPTVVAGGTAVLRRRFSASSALPDIRKYGCTYFNYVGKPLSYILAQPERPDDAENPLEFVFGNEAADLDIERFSKRFDVPVMDSYGSTETGAIVSRVEGMPKGALGRGGPEIKVLDPETGPECPPAIFDAKGRLRNAEEAIGELVNTGGVALFEGYYKNDEANAKRTRNGWYWTGDLAYRDAEGFLYFAGRDFEWLRVDGENFAAAPVERILARYPGVVLAAVYAVPDAEVGDQVMAALEMQDPESFDPAAFDAFLSAQEDLGTKWAPRYVRVSRSLPVTQTSKVQKRQLRSERWECDELVWFRPERADRLRRLEPEDREALRAAFAARGRESLLI
ncbi:MAG: AMP-binding protein [Thermoanaerobaculia bacterium]